MSLGALHAETQAALAKERERKLVWVAVRQAWDVGVPTARIAELIGVNHRTVQRMARRLGWPHRRPGSFPTGPRGPLSFTCPNCGTSQVLGTARRRLD